MPLIHLETRIAAPIARCFDIMRDVDAHTRSAKASQERVVAGVTHGLLESGDEVTWEAVHFGLRQRLTVRVTQCDPPRVLVDEMVRGAFASLRHVHSFREDADGTAMIDDFSYTSPFGLLGRIADAVVLARYMRRLIERRATFIKGEAEGQDRADVEHRR